MVIGYVYSLIVTVRISYGGIRSLIHGPGRIVNVPHAGVGESPSRNAADGMIASRDSDKARTAAKQLAESTGRDIAGVGMDATDESQVRRGVEETVRRFGRIDVLTNCVGGGGGGATA